MLLSDISHTDHQASYTPETLQYTEMMTPEPWIFSFYNPPKLICYFIHGFWKISLY